MSEVYDEPIVVRLTQPVGPYPVGTEFGFKDVADAIRALGSSAYFTVVRTQDGDPIPPPTPEDLTEAERQALERARAARLIRGKDFDPLWDRVDGIPSAEDLQDMQAAVDSVAEVPALVETLTPGPGKEIVGGPDGPVQRDLLIDRKGQSVAGMGPDADNTLVKPWSNKIAPDVAVGTIAGGGRSNWENVIGGDPSTINNGNVPNETVTGTGAHYSTISGGYDHFANGIASTIAGGGHNIVRGGHGTTGGGSFNEANGDYATVAGGTANKATGHISTITGGQGNTASGNPSTVSGGLNNQATAISASIGGGQNNVASGVAATVPGGRENTASGAASTALGRDAKAYSEGMVAQSSGKFAAQGDAQAGRLTLRAVTTDAVTKIAGVNGAAAHQMQHASAMMYRMQVIARQASTNDAKGWTIEGVVQNPTGQPVTQVGGAATPTVVAESAGAAAWTCSIGVGSDSFFLNVTGEAGKTINWVALVEFVEVVV